MRRRLSPKTFSLAVMILFCSASLHGVEGPWLPAGLQGHNIWALEISPSGWILAGTAELEPKTMFLSTDFGFTWAEVSGLPGAEIWDIEIDPTDESIVYAGLNGAGVWKSLDGGASWEWSNLYGQIWEVDVSASHPWVLHAASESGGVYKSTDAGGSWTPLVSSGITNATAVAVHPTNPDIALAGTPFEGVFRTVDGGVTWSEPNTGFGFTPGVRSLFFDPLDPNTVYAGESWNGVFKSQNDLYLYSDTDGDGVEDRHVSLGAACTVLESPVGTFTATCTAELAHLSTYSLIAPLDTDADEVPDQFGSVADLCPETAIPEGVPLDHLKVNRFALTDVDTVFDTSSPPGEGRSVTYSTGDTAGCSCEQIIGVLELGIGHRRFGCSNSAMQRWIEGLRD